MEDLARINSIKLRRGLDADGMIYVDAYSFFSGSDFGYLAFYYQPLTNRWIIKSFKRNTSDPNEVICNDFKKIGE